MTHLSLLSANAIPAAGTDTPAAALKVNLGDVGSIIGHLNFDYGSGGTSVTCYLQTSLDGGTSWIDIASVQFTTADAKKIFTVNVGGSVTPGYTPGDAALTPDAVVDGVLGDRVRIKRVVVGTYADSTITVDLFTRAGIGAPNVAQSGVASAASEITISATGTSHAAGDTVGGLLTFADFARVNGGSVLISLVKASTNKKSITPRLRIHLFNASDATVAADDAAWKELWADRGKRLSYIDLPAMTTAPDTSGSDMSRAVDATVRLEVKAAAGTRTIYGYVETLDAVTTDNNQLLRIALEGVYLS